MRQIVNTFNMSSFYTLGGHNYKKHRNYKSVKPLPLKTQKHSNVTCNYLQRLEIKKKLENERYRLCNQEIIEESWSTCYAVLPSCSLRWQAMRGT